MLRRVCMLCSRVMACRRTVLLVLCLSYVVGPPWRSGVQAAVMPQGGVGLDNNNHNYNNNNINLQQQPSLNNNNNNANLQGSNNLKNGGYLLNKLNKQPQQQQQGVGNNVDNMSNNHLNNNNFPKNAGGVDKLWPAAMDSKNWKPAKAQLDSLDGGGPQMAARSAPAPKAPAERPNVGLGPPPLPLGGRQQTGEDKQPAAEAYDGLANLNQVTVQQRRYSPKLSTSAFLTPASDKRGNGMSEGMMPRRKLTPSEWNEYLRQSPLIKWDGHKYVINGLNSSDVIPGVNSQQRPQRVSESNFKFALPKPGVAAANSYQVQAAQLPNVQEMNGPSVADKIDGTHKNVEGSAAVNIMNQLRTPSRSMAGAQSHLIATDSMPKIYETVNSNQPYFEVKHIDVGSQPRFETKQGISNSQPHFEVNQGGVNSQSQVEVKQGGVNNQPHFEVKQGGVNNQSQLEVKEGGVNNQPQLEVKEGGVNNQPQLEVKQDDTQKQIGNDEGILPSQNARDMVTSETERIQHSMDVYLKSLQQKIKFNQGVNDDTNNKNLQRDDSVPRNDIARINNQDDDYNTIKRNPHQSDTLFFQRPNNELVHQGELGVKDNNVDGGGGGKFMGRESEFLRIYRKHDDGGDDYPEINALPVLAPVPAAAPMLKHGVGGGRNPPTPPYARPWGPRDERFAPATGTPSPPAGVDARVRPRYTRPPPGYGPPSPPSWRAPRPWGRHSPEWATTYLPPVAAGGEAAAGVKAAHPTVAYTMFNASYLKNNNEESKRIYNAGGNQQDSLRGPQAQDFNNNNNNGVNSNMGMDRERPHSWKRKRKMRKPGVTAPPSRPDMDMKKHVSWFEGSRMYAFRASPDTRLLIRHAPIPTQGAPWPLPQHYYPEEAVFSIRPEHFQFHAIGETCDVLDFQFERIRRNTFGDDWEKAEEAANSNNGGGWGDDGKYKEIRYVNVTVLKECPQFPKLNDDESYDLEVKRSGASIIAREVWGAVRALETFSQLIYQDDDGRYLINRTLINDFPRFPHRGVLLDTARHYLNKETIINNLEAMAQNKLNVFHWHIVDDQSFPFESKTFPNLTKNGAYDFKTHIYTHETIAEIIEEARLRGIRVVPEFDTPGHTLSWGFGQDYLLAPCYDYNRQPNGLYGPINPILKSTYVFLQKFFREVLAVFKDKYIHLGGDEVPFDCWESNPQINNFIRRNNLTDIRDVLGLYERKLLEIVTQVGKNRDKGSGYIVWQEVVDNGVNVKADTIVQVWMGDAFDVERMINMGLRVIFSTCWYLDYINYGQDWDKYYRCEQLDQLNDFQLKNSSLLLGGEVALWTEYADDENIMSRLWPRASAAAERLWSNKRVRDEVAASSRIEEQRCRMLRRGLKVGVLSGPGHCPVWSHKGKRQQAKESPIFSWSSHNDEMQFKSNYPQVYVVDMNAMYLVPVLIVICICCLTLITLAQDSKSKIVAILSYPVAGSSKKGVKGLLYIFMAFAFAWCIWTAPIWMNSWETSANKARPVPPSEHQGHN